MPGSSWRGEALVDLMVPDDPRHPVACRGGSPANTAIALARLGTPVAFAGRFGNDPFGDLLLANLADNGVDLGYAVEAAEPTSLAVVTLGADGVPTYGFHVSAPPDRPRPQHPTAAGRRPCHLPATPALTGRGQ